MKAVRILLLLVILTLLNFAEAWETLDGRLKEIAASDGKIVGVNKYDLIFIRNGITADNPKGTSWQSIPGRLKYIAAGDGKIGGVNGRGNIYFRTGITATVPQGTGWQRLSGSLKQLSIGDGKIMGVNNRDIIYYRTGISSSQPFGTGWSSLSGRLKYISVGDGKIVGVNRRDYIYVRTGVNSDTPYGTGWRRLDGRLKMIEVGNGRMIGANRRNNIYERVGATSANPAGGSWRHLSGKLKHVTLGNGKMMGVNNGDTIFYKAQSVNQAGLSNVPAVTAAPVSSIAGYATLDGRLKEIAASDGKIVGVSSNDLIFIRNGITADNPKGTSWQSIPGRLKYIAAGDGKIGGVNGRGNIYFRTGITATVPQGTGWQKLSGSLKQLSIGDGKIMGVNNRDIIYYRTGISSSQPFGTGWRSLSGKLKYISVGDGKIVGVNSRDYIYVRTGVNSATPYGTGWRKLDGRLKMIEVGNGRMIGANRLNNIYERVGATSANPAGGSWRHLSGKLKHVTLGNGKMMGVNSDDHIFYKAQTVINAGSGIVKVTKAPVVTIQPVLAEKIYGKVPKRTQDYVEFDIRTNDILGDSLGRMFGAAQVCPGNKGVTGFRLKKNGPSKRIIAVEMICQEGTVMSEECLHQKSGEWEPWLYCDSQETKDTKNFVIGVKYSSERGQGLKRLKMECSNSNKELGPQGYDDAVFASPLYSGCSTSAKLCGFAAEKGHREIGRMKVLCCSKAANDMKVHGEWRPMGNNICFGAKNDNYGFLRVPFSGFLAGVKFEYLHGAVTCATNKPTYLSRFGCDSHPAITRAFALYVSKVDKTLLFPEDQQRNAKNNKMYMVLGKNAKTADNFTLNAFNPQYVAENEELQFWYHEDYINRSERDNGGITCVKVYGKLF